jgi:hypothetical protein
MASSALISVLFPPSGNHRRLQRMARPRASQFSLLTTVLTDRKGNRAGPVGRDDRRRVPAHLAPRGPRAHWPVLGGTSPEVAPDDPVRRWPATERPPCPGAPVRQFRAPTKLSNQCLRKGQIIRPDRRRLEAAGTCGPRTGIPFISAGDLIAELEDGSPGAVRRTVRSAAGTASVAWVPPLAEPGLFRGPLTPARR